MYYFYFTALYAKRNRYQRQKSLMLLEMESQHAKALQAPNTPANWVFPKSRVKILIIDQLRSRIQREFSREKCVGPNCLILMWESTSASEGWFRHFMVLASFKLIILQWGPWDSLFRVQCIGIYPLLTDPTKGTSSSNKLFLPSLTV